MEIEVKPTVYLDALTEKPFEIRGASYRIVKERKLEYEENGKKIYQLKIFCNVKREFVPKQQKKQEKHIQKEMF